MYTARQNISLQISISTFFDEKAALIHH